MDENRINALLAALSEQRNAALNQVVELSASLAVVKNEVEQLKKELEAATAILADSATVVEKPDA